jgi:hypothetical protein
MPLSTDTMIRVAHADVAAHLAFPRSVAHWDRTFVNKGRWKELSGDCDPILIGRSDGVVVNGNCSNDVCAPDGGVVHVCGDLASRISVGDHCEIVIAGDVLPNASIDASGFCHVFAGGTFCGSLRSADSAKVWIESDFTGSIATGTPSTEICIGGDYDGHISPAERAALLYLTVGGFAAHAALLKIADHDYTQFHASVRRSDVAPGLYPQDGHRRKASGGNSLNRWCVAAGAMSDLD